MNNWISVKERLPEPETNVLITAKSRKPHKGESPYWVFYAFYENGKVNMEQSQYFWDCDGEVKESLEADKENNSYFVPKGWFESVWFSERFSPIPDYFDVIAWQPLPKPYKPYYKHKKGNHNAGKRSKQGKGY
jgi:hypothetical protein